MLGVKVCKFNVFDNSFSPERYVSPIIASDVILNPKLLCEYIALMFACLDNVQ